MKDKLIRIGVIDEAKVAKLNKIGITTYFDILNKEEQKSKAGISVIKEAPAILNDISSDEVHSETCRLLIDASKYLEVGSDWLEHKALCMIRAMINADDASTIDLRIKDIINSLDRKYGATLIEMYYMGKTAEQIADGFSTEVSVIEEYKEIGLRGIASNQSIAYITGKPIKINCRKYAKEVKEKVKEAVNKRGDSARIDAINKVCGVGLTAKVPSLLIVLIGDNEASKAYIKGKLNDCEEVGIKASKLELPQDISQNDAEAKIREQINVLNPSGVIIQLPVPDGLDAEKLINVIPKDKDIDGLREGSKFKPCTPLGVVRLIKKQGIKIDGQNVVVIGRSKLVGKPLASMLTDLNATVTLCHSHTKNLEDITKRADIIISATGKKNLIRDSMVKSGVVLIDIGISRDSNGKLVGDINPKCYERSSMYTTVPGGIGLVTRATLLENLLYSVNK